MAALLGAAGGVLGLGSGAATAAPAATAPPVLRVMPLGDSITQGFGSSDWGGYREPLAGDVAAQTRYTVHFVGSGSDGPATFGERSHEGHGGWRINDISGGVDSWLGLQRPDVVLLHLGLNDLQNNDDPAHAPDRLKQLLDRIYTARPGITVILQGLIPTTACPGCPAGTALPGLIQQYNSRISQFEPAQAQLGRHFRYVDAPALDPTTEFAGVGDLHPRDAGYKRMADAFFPALDQAFSSGWLPGNTPVPGSAPEVSSHVRWADFDGDGRADYLYINDDGSVTAYRNNGGDTAAGPGWQSLGKIATGVGSEG
ncbi:GDSL-type esterase/lipase family protein [Kitasatospora sp. NPDC088351]|uniref:GDSL-type esterase/lipase family protein n=1 Tax=Kitasatospora sp. NPDC088351 TaxID=3155180 RepID=UPI00342FB8CD